MSQSVFSDDEVGRSLKLIFKITNKDEIFVYDFTSIVLRNVEVRQLVEQDSYLNHSKTNSRPRFLQTETPSKTSRA